MVLSLVLASCAPAVVEEEEGAVVPVVEEEEVVEEEVAPGVEMVYDSAGNYVEKPRYGGVFRWCLPKPIARFDEMFGSPTTARTQKFTNEGLATGDYAAGPSGRGEVSWKQSTFPAPEHMRWKIAESIEIVDETTFRFKIRQGIYWDNKPPVNGRQLVADDVVYSHTRHWGNQVCYVCTAYPYLEDMENVENSIYVDPDDPWAVIYKTQPGKAGFIYEMATLFTRMHPREVVETYGDMNDWKNANGTGPYRLVDYVPDSVAIFEAKDDYWDTHPLFPEDRMPYPDSMKYYIMTDESTRVAALRTAKLDQLGGSNEDYGAIGWEDAGHLIQTNPELKWVRHLNTQHYGPHYRIDKPELPIYDKRVRQALNMAINNQEIADTYYGGEAEVYWWPVVPDPDYAAMFVPFEDLPESAQKQFEYHPEEAKQLLAEAGYPDGFETQVMCESDYVDILAIIKSYWEDIGVDLKIDVREYAVYYAARIKDTMPEMYCDMVQSSSPLKPYTWMPGNYWNHSNVDDPYINESLDVVWAQYWDTPYRCEKIKELNPYVLDLALCFPVPTPYVYVFWWPWVKSYSGECTVGYADWTNYALWVWIDQDMREEMTGRR